MSTVRNTIKLSEEAWDLVVRALEERDTAEALQLVEEIKAKRTITLSERLYIETVEGEDGELECDEDALVSEGEDRGAYVQTWTWVTCEQAGVFRPNDKVLVTPTCGPAAGHEFVARVTDQRKETEGVLYTVTDQDGDSFDVEAKELELIEE